ncbi:hypothetical protein NAU58_21165 [Pseudomonas stutzeri]|uniref:hypothetical protein n=1 Tax=Stutzerimonas stutzeri TaxID=316 RepID=UPI002108CD2A|nr:hypothetical protein [Stutzerimonas stutzeri]MCQ4298092.1 hypothetical protein [Stutzerimonas stutzeri]
MTIEHLKNQAIYQLPKALENQSGQVDQEILAKLWQRMPKSGSVIRALIKDLSSAPLSPKDNALEKLASLLTCSLFLTKWLTQEKKHYPPLSTLINSYFELNDKTLSFASLKKLGFFAQAKNSKDKYLPDLNKIPDLVDRIEKSQLQVNYLALFVWQLLTNSRIAKPKYPHEKSIQEFELRFTSALQERNLDVLLDLTKPGNWAIDLQPQCTNSTELESDSPPSPTDTKHNAHPKVTISCETTEHLLADKLALEAKLDNYNQAINLIIFRAKQLLSDDDPTQTLRSLKDLAQRNEELYCDINSRAQEIASNIDCKLLSEAERLCIAIELPEPPKLQLSAHRNWIASLTRRIEDNRQLLDLASRIDQSNISEFEPPLSPSMKVSHEQLKAILESKLNKNQTCQAGLEALETIRGSAKKNLLNLSWNLFQDELIDKKTWRELTAYYILARKLGPSLGIALSYTLDDFQTDFASMVTSQLSTQDHATIAKIIQSISWLTLAQQESLAKSQAELRTLVALCQLDAYFQAVKSTREYYVYWSSSPLSDIANTHHNVVVRTFFSAIYELVSAPGTDPISYASIAWCISRSQIGKATSTHEKASLAKFKDELNEILTFRRKGGRTTYAHIWQAAYEDIFAPLLEILKRQGIAPFIDAFRLWNNSFEIEYHLSDWKSQIPDHLKKRSEYDKFVRTQVNLKITEINNWLKVYESVTLQHQTVVSEPLKNLQKAIEGIFKARDSDCTAVRIWLEATCSDHPIKLNSYPCDNRELAKGINHKTNFSNIDAYHPRAFAKPIEVPISYEEIYTDDFLADLGLLSHENLINIYIENEIFEGYSSIVDDSAEEIPPALDRKVEKLIDEVVANLTQRVAALDNLRGYSEVSDLLVKAENHIENQQWRQAEATVDKAERVSIQKKGEIQSLEAKEKLLRKIERLGGQPEREQHKDNDALKSEVEKLLFKNQDRRRHILVIEKLATLNSTGFEEELSDCLNHLDQAKYFPTIEVSESVAYYLEQAIEPIVSELSRSRTLLATYVSQLKKLGRILLINIRHDQALFDEESPLISILLDTAHLWQNLAIEGKSNADRIINLFEEKGVSYLQTKSDERQAQPPSFVIPSEATIDLSVDCYEELKIKAKEAFNSQAHPHHRPDQELTKLINARDWTGVSEFSLASLSKLNFDSLEHLANWSISECVGGTTSFKHNELSAILRLVNDRTSSTLSRFMLQEKATRVLIADMAARFVNTLADEVSGKTEARRTPLENLQLLNSNIDLTIAHKHSFRQAFENAGSENTVLKSFWDKFAGEQKQADARALFMYLAWKLQSATALEYCLTLPPIDLERRKAEALAKVANDALITGNSNLLQGFFDLKKSIQAKPFQIFADLILSKSIPQSENPARLSLLGGLERQLDGTLRGIIRIEPRRVDSPDSISLQLPANSPVRFADGTLYEQLQGPFFTDTSLPVSFILLDELAVTFVSELTCAVISLTGVTSGFTERFVFTISGETPFEPLTPDEIDDAFENFPDKHMRGESYVARVIDERKIEKALFESKTVRSLWISSPRRSGKTTMLFRILDAFSHKAHRDNLVVYLTLDETFEDSASFNRWMWRRIRTVPANKELRELYTDFEAIGRRLPFDSDTGTFIGELSTLLLSDRDNATRIIFLIDEVDRFASMYFEGSTKRNTAVDILWQIRHMITDRRDIGIVFAGSSAAKQIFITDASSPFYNSIDHLELTPFSCKTDVMESASREIIEPHKIKFYYDLPKDSLEHLIWVCAGIPYYMKLVAGATYAIAKQSHILKSDINEGLRALLSKTTGISKLDDMGGDPGSDDLRTTISLEKSTDATIAKAVLYSFADLHSPISGHKSYRGKITSSESRLVSHYKLPKALIEHGLDICIKLGLMRLIETESVPEIDFSIPILGESIRKASGRLWANIDHQLIELSQQAS